MRIWGSTNFGVETAAPGARFRKKSGVVENARREDEQAGSMGDKGRSVADQKFNIRRQAEQLGELYLDLIRNSKRFKSGSS